MPQLPTTPSPMVCLSATSLNLPVGDTDWIPAGPVAENVMDQSAKTTAEMSNLAAARHPPNYTAATGQPLTHYHSFFSELLSWRNPRTHNKTTAARKQGADMFQVPRPSPTPPSSPSSSRLGTSMLCAGLSSSPGWSLASPSPPRSPGRPS